MIKWRVALWFFFTKYDDSGALFLMPFLVHMMNLVPCSLSLFLGYDNFGALLLVPSCVDNV